MHPKKKKGNLVDLGRQMQEIVDRAFRQAMYSDPAAGTIYLPSVDLAETPGALLVVMELAGVVREDVEIKVEGEVLRIIGRRREFLPEDVARYHHVEIDRGSFERVIQIPPGFELDEAEANLHDGLLFVRLPRKDTEGKVIEVSRDDGKTGEKDEHGGG